MSAQSDATKNEADKHASMVVHHSHNAEKYLRSKDYHKASEMMWGAMSCALKMVAAKKNQEPSRPSKVRRNVIQTGTR